MEKIGVFFGISVLAVSLGAQVKDTETISRKFPLSAGAAPEITAGVITGAIKVTAHDTREIVLTAKVSFEARDAAELAELKKAVRLESEQTGNNVWIGVETNNFGCCGSRSRQLGWRSAAAGESKTKDSRSWSFRHDLELKVPRESHLKLNAVNGGALEMDGISGEFRLNNVSGGIHLRQVHGYGSAKTVNGPITMEFAKGPTGKTSIRTVNGKVQLYLDRNTGADFSFKTMHGQIHSDFPLVAQAATQTAPEERGMKRIWRAGGPSTARLGGGGPQIEINTLNGGIFVLEKKN